MFALTTDSPTRHGGMVTRLGLALAALLALLVGLALPGGGAAAAPRPPPPPPRLDKVFRLDGRTGYGAATMVKRSATTTWVSLLWRSNSAM
jgi:hypothetical protein